MDTIISNRNLIFDSLVYLEWAQRSEITNARNLTGYDSNPLSDHDDYSSHSVQNFCVLVDTFVTRTVHPKLLFHEHRSINSNELCDGLLHQHHLYRIFDTRLTHTRDDYKKEIQLRTHI